MMGTLAAEMIGKWMKEYEGKLLDTADFIFCHPENLASRRTAEKLCHLYPEHFQLVLEEL